MRGNVEDVAEHYYSSDYSFPGHGTVVECCIYSEKLQKSDIGNLQRENCDTQFLAWLTQWRCIKTSGTDKQKNTFKEAAARVRIGINCRRGATEHQMAAFQHREDEDKAGQRLGHGTLMKAREMFSLQASARQLHCARSTGHAHIHTRRQHPKTLKTRSSCTA